MRPLVDHHYAAAIATHLRALGHDVALAAERGWQAKVDETLLEHSSAERRALLTNNLADLAVIAVRWAALGRQHCGLVFTSDRSLPRSRDTIGVYVTRLDALLVAHPGDSALLDRVTWLA